MSTYIFRCTVLRAGNFIRRLGLCSSHLRIKLRLGIAIVQGKHNHTAGQKPINYSTRNSAIERIKKIKNKKESMKQNKIN